MLRWFPLLLLILLSGCVKNEVTLTFELTGGVNMPCRILYYASVKNRGMIRETVVDIRGGKGEIKLPERYPSLVYLFAPSQQTPAAILYIRRGDKIKITGSGDDIAEWKISGNKISEQLSDWRRKNSDLLKKNKTAEINKAVKEYVEKNPDSPASAILLYVYYSRKGNEREFARLIDGLSKKVKEDEELMNALSVGDLMTGLPDRFSIPRELILMGEEGYADTLLTGNGHGTLLLFADNDNFRSGNFRSSDVRMLANENSPKLVAEIFAEADSVAWRRHLRSDSLPDGKRLWMPLGLVDANAIGMGVRRLPYFIVLDGEGRETYRGDNWQDASEKFKELSP